MARPNQQDKGRDITSMKVWIKNRLEEYNATILNKLQELKEDTDKELKGIRKMMHEQTRI